ncbi:MAG: hypothetical protein HY329_14665 [Chloroflexi bacterium]|nr:hypothetical protein [Chloroflexota bacterium]
MTTGADLATHRALHIMGELNLDPGDAETLRRIRGFILVNGYPGVLHAAEITKNRSLDHVRRGRSPIRDRWHYCRSVNNRATGYASWAFLLLNLVEVSLRAWIDGAFGEYDGPDWHLRLRQHFRTDTVDRIEADLQLRKLSLAGFQSGADFLDALELGALRSMIRDGYNAAPHRARLLLPRLPTDKASGPYLEPKRLQSQLWRLNDVRNDVMHHRLLTTTQFQRFLGDVRDLLLRRDFDIDRTIERVETGRLQAVDDAPEWLRAPASRAVMTHTPNLLTQQLLRALRAEVPEIARGDVQIGGIGVTPASPPRVVVAVTARGVDPLPRCPSPGSAAMQKLLHATGVLDIRFVRRSFRDPIRLVNAILAPLRVTSLTAVDSDTVILTFPLTSRDAVLAHDGIEQVAQILQTRVQLEFL